MTTWCMTSIDRLVDRVFTSPPRTPHHPVNTVQGGPGDGHCDGTIDGIGFTVVYRRGHGRDMKTFAC